MMRRTEPSGKHPTEGLKHQHSTACRDSPTIGICGNDNRSLRLQESLPGVLYVPVDHTRQCYRISVRILSYLKVAGWICLPDRYHLVDDCTSRNFSTPYDIVYHCGSIVKSCSFKPGEKFAGPVRRPRNWLFRCTHVWWFLIGDFWRLGVMLNFVPNSL